MTRSKLFATPPNTKDLGLKSSSPRNQVDDDENDCNDQEKMNQSPADMTDKTKQPKYDENYRNGV
jgi:hypothetical protein